MALAELILRHKQAILERWRLHVAKKLAGHAVDRGALEDGWSAFLDALAELAARGDDTGAPLDGSAHGAQRLRLGFDASELVRETGSLHRAILDVADAAGSPLDAREQQLLVRGFYAILATAVGEHARRRDADVERETIEQLGRLSGDLGHEGAALRRVLAWAESRTTFDAAEADGGERFSLAGVLADAVADVRLLAAARGVPVLVDLATPIEVSGARDLLRRALARILRSAVAATRPGGNVVARAQMLSGGRARIDVRDECGGGGVVPAGHCVRPSTALAAPRSAADWAIVRGAVAANRGTVHARRLPGVGCLVTIDVPGRGDEAPCCEAETATGR